MDMDTMEVEVDIDSSSNADRPIFQVGCDGSLIMGEENVSDETSTNSNSAIPSCIPSTSADILAEDEENSLTDLPEKEDESPPEEPDSVSLSQSESDSTGKLKTKTSSRLALAADVTHVQIQPSDILEYEWPQKSGDHYFVQEQISQLLGITSFKRKYPEMARRTVEPKERDHLLKELNLKLTLNCHHLTALHAVDVHELMSAEYSAIYADYQKACSERVKQAMLEKQKELEAIKLDAKKLDELRQKAIKNASEFNADLQYMRRTERQEFWDTNTNLIHSPLNKWVRLRPEHTKPPKCPVFLLPGQYIDNYTRFHSAQLRTLPFNTMLENDDLFAPKRGISPPPLTVSQEELEASSRKYQIKYENGGNQQQDTGGVKRLIKQELPTPRSPAAGPLPPKLRKMSTNSHNGRRNSFVVPSPKAAPSPKMPAASPKVFAPSPKAPLAHAICSICQMPDPSPAHKALLVRCSACQQQMHSSCIDMPLSMVEVIRHYDWLCIDCKRCSVCQQPDQEAAMMCCDLCDRGYHTFCIGLDQPPNGTWHCPECKGD